MLRRVMPELIGGKRPVLVLNDEGHHCYRERPGAREADDLTGEEKDEARKNNEAARLWITGIEIVKRKDRRPRLARPLRHSLLPARLRLRGRHALPLDGERLLPDGRHRVRHRQGAEGSRRG